MTEIDLLLLGVLGGFVFGGWRTGFVRRLASLLFLAVSFVAAAYLREPLGAIVEAVAPSLREGYPGFIAFAVAFGALFIVLNVTAGRVLSRVAVGGMSRATDQVLGAALGLVEGALIASVGIVLVTTYTADPLLGAATQLGLLPDIAGALEASAIARILSATTVPFVLGILGPLLPSDITSIAEMLPGAE